MLIEGGIVAAVTAALAGIGKWLQQNGGKVVAAAGAAAAGAAVMAICKEKDFKKRAKQIEKDNAIKFNQEQKRKMEEIRAKYENNEAELRKNVNEYLRSQGFNVSF